MDLAGEIHHAHAAATELAVDRIATGERELKIQEEWIGLALRLHHSHPEDDLAELCSLGEAGKGVAPLIQWINTIDRGSQQPIREHFGDGVELGVVAHG